MDILEDTNLLCLDTWGKILSPLPDSCLYTAILISKKFQGLVQQEITCRYIFWFGPDALPPNICQEYQRKITLTLYEEPLIDHTNPDSPLALPSPHGYPALFFGRSQLIFEGMETHTIDIDTYKLIVENSKTNEKIGFEAPTDIDMVELLHSGRSIPLTPKIVNQLLPIFPTGKYDVFKLRLQVTAEPAPSYSYPSSFVQSHCRDCFCFREATNKGRILMFPLFCNWDHINQGRVDYYRSRMESDPYYEPTVLLFGFSAFYGSVNWIIDGHHKMIAAAGCGRYLRFILFHYFRPRDSSSDVVAEFKKNYLVGNPLGTRRDFSNPQDLPPQMRDGHQQRSQKEFLSWLPASYCYSNPNNAYSWWTKLLLFMDTPWCNEIPTGRPPRADEIPTCPPFTAFIEGFSCGENFLTELFSNLNVKSVRGPLTEQNRYIGYAFVEFETAEDLMKALEADSIRMPFIGSPLIRVSIAERKPGTRDKNRGRGGHGGSSRGGGRGRGGNFTYGPRSNDPPSRADQAKSWRK